MPHVIRVLLLVEFLSLHFKAEHHWPLQIVLLHCQTLLKAYFNQKDSRSLHAITTLMIWGRFVFSGARLCFPASWVHSNIGGKSQISYSGNIYFWHYSLKFTASLGVKLNSCKSYMLPISSATRIIVLNFCWNAEESIGLFSLNWTDCHWHFSTFTYEKKPKTNQDKKPNKKTIWMLQLWVYGCGAMVCTHVSLRDTKVLVFLLWSNGTAFSWDENFMYIWTLALFTCTENS